MIQALFVSVGIALAGAADLSEPPSRTIRVDRGHAGMVWLTERFGKDTSRLLIAYPDQGRFEIRDLATGGIEEHLMPRRSGKLRLQAVSFTGRTLLFRDQRGKSLLYSVPRGEYYRLQGERGTQVGGYFGAYSRETLFAVDSTRERSWFKRWDEDGKLIDSVDLGKGEVKALSSGASAADFHVIRDGEIQLWSMYFKRSYTRVPWGFDEGSLTTSPNGQFLAAASEDGEIYVRDIYRHVNSWNLGTRGSRVVQVAFANESRNTIGEEEMVAVTSDGWVRRWILWRHEAGPEFRSSFIRQAEEIRISRGATRLAAAHSDGRIRVWFLK